MTVLIWGPRKPLEPIRRAPEDANVLRVAYTQTWCRIHTGGSFPYPSTINSVSAFGSRWCSVIPFPVSRSRPQRRAGSGRPTS